MLKSVLGRAPFGNGEPRLMISGFLIRMAGDFSL